jgi:GMP synthase (glutamine-hydrolysing)
MPKIDKILILDFGSQYTSLIARRIREMNVLAEIRPPTLLKEELLNDLPKGIILSGGPGSVYDGAIPFDSSLLHLPIPVLGICYGMQLLNSCYNGSVKSLGRGEYGKQLISLKCPSPSLLFQHLSTEEVVWMSHKDSIDSLAPEFYPLALSKDGIIAAIQHQDKPHFGVQFHPEVTHTQKGSQILDNFLKICQCSRTWTMKNYLESTKEEIRAKVGNGRIVSLVSGGVDSTAATILCCEALGADKVYPLHIDTGLMREGESYHVKNLLENYHMGNLSFVDASQEFLDALKDVIDPEEKRQIIGNLFIQILDREIAKLDKHEGRTFFCQGTLYTDLIESGKGCGQHAAIIKSHHNVNPPIVEKKRKEGLIIEPNARIFKDEVRRLSEELGIPKHLIWRHPFPGPGLAIRILGKVTPEALETLRKADQIYLEEIQHAALSQQIWQAFAVLIPVTTVGVMGDKRTEGQVIALRAVSSVDGMTAEFFPISMDVLGHIAARIINEVPNINRVVYDVTSKPPGTIEWQ